jgi:signal transduction histidine kinase
MIENAVYFCCLEAIQNALKHGAPPVDVSLHQEDGHLAFEIADRGTTFRASSSTGSGVQNMRDRMAAIGGELSIAANRDGGTSVLARVPLGPLRPPPFRVQVK